MNNKSNPAELQVRFPSWPLWGAEEENALRDTAEERIWGTLGPRTLRFAERFAAYCDCRHAVMTSSGTLSLELALRGLGIGEGDEVILPLYTFAATLSAVCMAGATPVLADVELHTANISAAVIEPLITKKTKAILVVHLAGRPCPMDEICSLADRLGIAVIEDCAQAHGARWKGRRVGSFGAAGTFSFQSSKNLTCGEGGAIVTNNLESFTEFWRYHTSGRAYEGSSEFGGRIQLGTNARMTEWQAAILNVQMNRLDAQNAARRKNASLLTEAMKKLTFLTLPEPPGEDIEHAWHLFTVNLADDAVDRDDFIRKLALYGIPAIAGYPYLDKLTFLKDYAANYDSLHLPNTELLSKTAIWLPGAVLLAEETEIEKLAPAFKEVYSAVKR